MNGSEAIVRTLQGLGVEVFFGLCGDTTLPLYEALYDIHHGMRHVLTRDERSASFMADAYARFSGRVGVCEGPSGGGATYILPGVAEANGSSAPLVCLTSDIAQADVGRGTLTELDQNSLFRPVTKATYSPSSAAVVSRVLHDAFRTATSGALGATHVRLPFDVQTGNAGSELHIREGGDRYPAFRMDPERELVEKAARVLSEPKRPLIIAGAGVVRSGAWDEVTELAHRLGAPVATSIGGKGSIAETDPYALGVIGSNGGLPYRHAFVHSADVIFYVGCSLGSVTTEKWTLPRNGEHRILQLTSIPRSSVSTTTPSSGSSLMRNVASRPFSKRLRRLRKSIRPSSSASGRFISQASRTRLLPTRCPSGPSVFSRSSFLVCRRRPSSARTRVRVARRCPRITDCLERVGGSSRRGPTGRSVTRFPVSSARTSRAPTRSASSGSWATGPSGSHVASSRRSCV